MYLELHTSSAFSFLDGASLPATLIERAASLGYPAVALLDRDGVYGAPQFYRAAKAAGLKAIVGAELTIGDGSTPTPSAERRVPDAERPSWTLPVLVASAEGYRTLCRLITRSKLRAPKGEARITLEDLDGFTTGLVALVGRPALHAARHGVGGLVDRVVGLFGRDRVWMEVQRHLHRADESDVHSLLDLASAFRVPVMASNGVRFASPESRPLYDVFTCLRHKATLSEAGRRLSMNAERYLKPPETMARLFSDLPQALAGTEALAERLEFTLANLGYRFPEYPVPAGETEASFLRRLTLVGARDRYRPYHDRARAQIARELDLIEKLELAGYFLIVWDIVNFCRQQGILVQGRGSAANSAVCYSLGITAVDPIGMELLFERFLSEERGEWPDIDLDLPSGDRRERVIQYVYSRYGLHGAAMTANVITYRGRSAAREVGKVLELEEQEIDRLARLMSQFEFVDPHDTLARHLREADLNPDDPRYQLFGKLWTEMQDLPRHLGQHSGGMVVCRGRLDDVVPLEPATMPGRVVVQWDKDDCADLGIVKVDLLGLGMMAALEEAIKIVNGEGPGARDQGPAVIDLAHLPPDDPAVYAMLQRADTVGLFQVESRAQMATLPRMKPQHFYDIVVEVAIIRPGPIVGNMVHPYLARRRGDEPVTYDHPLLEPVLERTLGVPLFQEQLLRMAMVVAGFSGGEAEELRRAMGFKRSVKRMQQIETRLREGMAANGIVGAAADRIVLSITSFALYGFPESHAASFALIVYASAYLKAHFPAAFYTALLNNQPMGFYAPATLVKDAQRHGVHFAPICVQESHWNCHVQNDGLVRLGLRYVRGLREQSANLIERPREEMESAPVAGRALGGGASDNHREPERVARAASVLSQAFGGRAPNDTRESERVARATSVSTQAFGGGASDNDREPERIARATSVLTQAFGGGASDNDREPERVARATSVLTQAFGGGASDNDREPERIARAASVLSGALGGGAPSATKKRWHSIDSLAIGAKLRRDEITALAEVGALASLGGDRRTALWQAARGPNPEITSGVISQDPNEITPDVISPMTDLERVRADYDGTGLTIGRHPMSFCRASLAARGVLRASDLARARPGRRVRVAGAVITRQRPGTAKGFVFLSLEDETGIANVIITPDTFGANKRTIVDEPYLLVEGPLQNQDGSISVKADRVEAVTTAGPVLDSHDFH